MKNKNQLNRRSFLKKSGVLMATTPLVNNLWGVNPTWAGANDRVRIAVVGIRGMGFSHIKNYSQLENVEVAALCDVDENLFPERVKWLADNNKPKPKLFRDIRKLLEDKEIDAISVASPNHWHALSGIWAAQAGKHATLEKPGTHNVFEGRQLIKAAQKYQTLIQHHAERRSFPGFQSAMNFLHSGGLGEVYLAKGLCYKWRDTIGKMEDGIVPQGVDYDLWLGPAPKRPFNPNRFHYNWHWHWDYGNGDMGNQGAHQMDIARWGLGVKHPSVISSMGGHFMFDDDQETPNTQIAVFEFPTGEGGGDKKKMLQFEVRHWISNHEGGIGEGASNNIGNLFYGSKGYMVIDLSGNWKTYMGKDREPGPTGEGRGNMFQNFVDSIRANDSNILEGSMEEGHYSCSLMHLANISYRVGRRLQFDPEKEIILNDPDANELLTRDYRHPFVVPKNV
ncbi:MAG: Gfo/Idh/MocA family oxidoreductase [Cyclobacteriaceae bacterium]